MIVVLGVGARFAPEPVAQLFGPMTVERFVGGGVVDPGGTGGVFARARAHQAGWTVAARTWPWGAGFGGFDEAYLKHVEPGARHALEHAHHQLIQLLAEGGLLGLLTWMIPLVAAVWRLGARGRWVLAPFIAVQAVLWGIESPLLFAGAFYATWAALGLARQASRGAWPIRAPCVPAVTVAGIRPSD